MTKREEIEKLLRWWVVPQWLHKKEKEGNQLTKKERIELMQRTVCARVTVKEITDKIFNILEGFDER